MFTRTLILASLLITSSGAALADSSPSFVDRARVISSTPIYQQVNEPQRQCWNETVSDSYQPQQRSYGGAILGGLVGGLLGNTVGQGNGRTAAAAVGAVTGALVGNNISNNNNDNSGDYAPRQVQRCREVDNYHQVVSGYSVDYQYHGQDYNTTLPYDPGKYVNLDVSAVVAQQEPGGY
jgi:uncharacterized protein YcfJ